jgi:hypothetical protein
MYLISLEVTSAINIHTMFGSDTSYIHVIVDDHGNLEH